MQTLLIGLTLLVSCKYKTDERAGILFLWKYSIIALVLNPLVDKIASLEIKKKKLISSRSEFLGK